MPHTLQLLLPLWSIWLIFQFLDHITDGRTPRTSDQPVARPLPKRRQHKRKINAYTHTHTHTHTKQPCLVWNSNPRSRLPSERIQYMLYTAGLPWPASLQLMLPIFISPPSRSFKWTFSKSFSINILSIFRVPHPSVTQAHSNLPDPTIPKQYMTCKTVSRSRTVKQTVGGVQVGSRLLVGLP
jgi:hypothetical protein